MSLWRRNVFSFIEMADNVKVKTVYTPHSSPFLLKALKRLYFFGQIFGCACFSYSEEQHRVYVSIINVISLIFFTIFYFSLAFFNLVYLKLSIEGTEFQKALFYNSVNVLPSYGVLYIWMVMAVVFISRKKLAKFVEQLITLEKEVCNYLHR